MMEKCDILLVDDDPNVITVLGGMLQEFGQLRFATSGADGLRLARQSVPDLILLDIEMPGMSGFELCSALKEDPLVADVPVIFITSNDDTEQEVAGLALGAVDFIAKPPRAPIVAARVRTHLRTKRMADALRRAAATDAVTGIANRRQFDEKLAHEWLRAQRTNAPLSLLMVDIDFFKDYNDRYGHPAGDRCLRDVAQAMQTAVHRPADLLARYGGEEFALILPDTDAHGARCIAQKLIRVVEELHVQHETSHVAQTLTISVGASAYDDACAACGARGADARGVVAPRYLASDLVAVADRALYAAKKGGRRQYRLMMIDGMEAPGATMEFPAGPEPQHQAAA